ncbi:hypothetical protein AB0469_10290 [Streptomyces sp. NPDC093801]|uniref:hypothetical protein n=1 Tax=Streptomyces sp. NPDC093801 TaxID=3155203 RepID=UPI00344E6F54
MEAERAQGGRGWVRIPASRAEQPPSGPPAPKPYGGGSYGADQYGGGSYGTDQYGSGQYGGGSYGADQYGSGSYGAGEYGGGSYGGGPYGPGEYGGGPYPQGPFRGTGPYGLAGAGPGDPAAIYLSLLKRWREAGRTLPGHPDEEWERLISQPCWPGR